MAALALHGVLVLSLQRSGARAPTSVSRPPPATEFVEIQPAPPVPPPPEKPKPPEEAPPPARAPRPNKVAAPPPPAQAAAVLAAKEDPLAPADLTDSMVMGNAAAYVGGTSSANGTNSRPPRVAVHGGTGSGAGRSPTGTGYGPDRTRRPQLAEGNNWSCPFPPEANDAQVDHAIVSLRIAVDADGHPTDVAITSDPGNGFGREARSCALNKVFQPALDHAGQPARGTTLVNVRFDR